MDPTAALREHFGFDGFRPGQEEAVRAAIGPPARDALVVMPTGAGKSLCYQLPALMRDDLTIVVSPLVSLMQDQVDALAAIAPGRVALVNSQRDSSCNRAALARAAAGELALLYVAPERFSSPPFLEAMRAARIGLFVVDEAHCVSHWGHDFRPDYFRLADAARWLGADAIVASTATATPQVARDIELRLGLREPVRVATGFDRPNICFAVISCASSRSRQRQIAGALAGPCATPAIVYCGTRAGAEQLAVVLRSSLADAVGVYHAGVGRAQRADVQRRFMGGELGVVVATNAFGMGIDKADVRTVCHASVPSSIEAYYQEAGRAGRDGLAARALLFAERRDKGLHVFFIQRGDLSEDAIAAVARELELRAEDGRFDIATDDLAQLLGARGEELDHVRAVIGHLARAGVLRLAPSTADRVRGRLELPFDARARVICRTSARDVQRARWRQYRAVWAYVEGSACRRRTILRHFGDRRPPSPNPATPCCDACDASWVPVAAPARRGRRDAARAAVVSPPPVAATGGDPCTTRAGGYGAAAEPARGHGPGPSVPAGSATTPATRDPRHDTTTPAARDPGGQCAKTLPVGERTPRNLGALGDLGEAIVSVVASTSPPVGRTRAVQILRGGRSRELVARGYDGLPEYGTFDHLSAADVLGRVDELLQAGCLRSTGGPFPKLATDRAEAA